MTLSGIVKGINTLPAQPSIVLFCFSFYRDLETPPSMQRTENKRRGPFNRPPDVYPFSSVFRWILYALYHPPVTSKPREIARPSTLLAIRAVLFPCHCSQIIFFFPRDFRVFVFAPLWNKLWKYLNKISIHKNMIAWWPISWNKDALNALQRGISNVCFNVELKELGTQKKISCRWCTFYGNFPFAIPAQQSVSRCLRIISRVKDLSAHFCVDYRRTLWDVNVSSLGERRRSRRNIGIIASDRGHNHREVLSLTDFRQQPFRSSRGYWHHFLGVITGKAARWFHRFLTPGLGPPPRLLP